jgi:hypothetical protein
MTENEKFAIAAHLYVLLRRKIGRVIDTVWMVQNTEYAQEVLRIAHGHADAEIEKLARRFETLMLGSEPTGPAPRRAPAAVEAPVVGKYVGSLR